MRPPLALSFRNPLTQLEPDSLGTLSLRLASPFLPKAPSLLGPSLVSSAQNHTPWHKPTPLAQLPQYLKYHCPHHPPQLFPVTCFTTVA